MIEAAAARLKQLTDDYANGELDFATYRRLRGELLDGLVAGPVHDTAGEAAGVALGEPGLAAGGAPPHVATAPRVRLGFRLAWGALVLVLVAAFAWLVVERHGPGDSMRDTIARWTSGSKAASPDAAREVVEGFLRDPDWSESRVARLHADWRSLPEAQRQSAYGRSWHQQMADAIRLQIKEQRALAESEENARLAPPLLMLAQEFGVTSAPADTAPSVSSRRCY